MSFIGRLVLAPVIFQAYVIYGAKKGAGSAIGILRGALVGAAFSSYYVITGEKLQMEQK
jgi:hypothetical protein